MIDGRVLRGNGKRLISVIEMYEVGFGEFVALIEVIIMVLDVKGYRSI